MTQEILATRTLGITEGALLDYEGKLDFFFAVSYPDAPGHYYLYAGRKEEHLSETHSVAQLLAADASTVVDGRNVSFTDNEFITVEDAMNRKPSDGQSYQPVSRDEAMRWLERRQMELNAIQAANSEGATMYPDTFSSRAELAVRLVGGARLSRQILVEPNPPG
ncbi:MAG: hypothetical protein WAO98_03610 [Alphaproteobacteria bacterium]